MAQSVQLVQAEQINQKSIFERMRENREWNKISKILNENSREEKFKREMFNEAQLNEITLGIKAGLSKEQIKGYAHPIFDAEKMGVIRRGMTQGINTSYFQNPLYSAEQMRIISNALEQGIDIEKKMPRWWEAVNPRIDCEKLKLVFYAMSKNYDLTVIPNIEEFTPVQLRKVVMGYDEGLTKGQIAWYSNKLYDPFQMDVIKEGLLRGSDVSIIANPYLDAMSMKIISNAEDRGVNPDILKRCATGQYHYRQVEQIVDACFSSLTMGQINELLSPEISSEKMKELKETYVLENMGIDKSEAWKFNSEQVNMLQQAYTMPNHYGGEFIEYTKGNNYYSQDGVNDFLQQINNVATDYYNEENNTNYGYDPYGETEELIGNTENNDRNVLCDVKVFDSVEYNALNNTVKNVQVNEEYNNYDDIEL